MRRQAQKNQRWSKKMNMINSFKKKVKGKSLKEVLKKEENNKARRKKLFEKLEKMYSGKN